MPKKHNKEVKSNLSKEESTQKKGNVVKNFVLEHLLSYKHQLKNSKKNAIKVLPFTLEDLGVSPIALELTEKDSREPEESSEDQTKRDQMADVVQQLIENVNLNDDGIVVVKVDTPAVDMNNNFDDEQLKFIKNDIFNSIQSQLGVELTDDVEEQWGTAFKTMMEIVEAEKKRH